jgi:hypothetical protein
MGGHVEQRLSSRYQLRLPVIFRWTDDNGVTQQGGGFTRDISTGGVFVICDAPPQPAACIALELLLPPLAGNAPGLRLQGNAQVVRAEQASPMIGFAALSDLDLPGRGGGQIPEPDEQRESDKLTHRMQRTALVSCNAVHST